MAGSFAAPSSLQRQLTCMPSQAASLWVTPRLPACYSLAGGIITGDVRVNGYPKEEKTFARVMGYVEQVCASSTSCLLTYRPCLSPSFDAPVMHAAQAASCGHCFPRMESSIYAQPTMP